MSLFASTTAPVPADGTLSPEIPAVHTDEITLSPKSPTRCTTTGTELCSSPDAWAEVEAADSTAETVDTRKGGATDEVARLRSANKSLVAQVAELHALLREHAELVETAAAEISPALRKPQKPATPQTWWGAAACTFRSVQSDDAIRAAEKRAVKTVADAARSAAEAATEGALDGALAALGHPELAPAADRLVDANANAIEDEAVTYIDSLIDATASSAVATDAPAIVESDTVEIGSGSVVGSDASTNEDPSSSSLLPDWSHQMAPSTSRSVLCAVGATATLAGLYAAHGRLGQPDVASALTALWGKMPAFPALPLIGGGTSSAASPASNCAQSNTEESLSLAPVLVSLGKKAATHVLGEGLPEMIQAGLGESGHSF